MLLNDKEIIDLCNGYKPLITPFSSDLVRQVADKKIISYGVSSYGYDLRAGDEYKVFTNVSCKEIDPKNIDIFVACKESELEEFEHSISDLEYNWYLHTV